MSAAELNDSMDAAQAVYRKYHDRYDGEIQGCCPLIADEISRATGGEVVAGELTLMGGSIRRTHWWVDLRGVTLDPMGDNIISHPDDYGDRVEMHRDRAIFEAILPRYEQWRI